MIIPFRTYIKTRIFNPAEKRYLRCKKQKKNMSNIGIVAQYVCTLSRQCPFNSRMMERCSPHPGQSAPSSHLYTQGIIRLSSPSTSCMYQESKKNIF